MPHLFYYRSVPEAAPFTDCVGMATVLQCDRNYSLCDMQKVSVLDEGGESVKSGARMG